MNKICISVESNYSVSFICGFSVLSYLDRPSSVMKLLSMLLIVLLVFIFQSLIHLEFIWVLSPVSPLLLSVDCGAVWQARWPRCVPCHKDSTTQRMFPAAKHPGDAG